MNKLLLIALSALFCAPLAHSADGKAIVKPIVSTDSVSTTIKNAGFTDAKLTTQMEFLDSHYNMGKEPVYSTRITTFSPRHRKRLNKAVHNHRTYIALYLQSVIRTSPTYAHEESAWQTVINQSATLNWPITYRLEGLRTLSLAGRTSELAQYPSQNTTC